MMAGIVAKRVVEPWSNRVRCHEEAAYRRGGGNRSRFWTAMMLRWLRRRREAARLVNADAEALLRGHGGEAYWEARRRERDVILPDGTTHQGRTPAHWGRVAVI